MFPTQNTWQWDSGVSHFRVRYAPGSENSSGMFTWTEEVAPEDDERGNGSHLESTQALTDFLRNGPHSDPPVSVVEAILSAFSALEPMWLNPYRLITATRAQDTATVKALLSKGAPPDKTVRPGGLTPFYWAVRLRDLPLAELIFTAGVDVNRHFPGSNETILMVLASSAPNDSWEPLAARIIVRGADLEARKQWGETTLMAAARAGSRLPGLVGLLMGAGADVNVRSTHGYTALMNAVSYRDAPVPIVRQLLAAGAAVNAADNEGWTALHRAISLSLVDCVRCLLATGADVQAVTAPREKNREPKSVLQLALDYANPEIIALVRAAGAA